MRHPTPKHWYSAEIRSLWLVGSTSQSVMDFAPAIYMGVYGLLLQILYHARDRQFIATSKKQDTLILGRSLPQGLEDWETHYGTYQAPGRGAAPDEGII